MYAHVRIMHALFIVVLISKEACPSNCIPMEFGMIRKANI